MISDLEFELLPSVKGIIYSSQPPPSNWPFNLHSSLFTERLVPFHQFDKLELRFESKVE